MPTTTLPSLASTVAARTVGLTKVYASGLTTVTALDDVSVELQRHRLLEGLDVDNTDEERQRCTAAYYGLVSYLDDNIGRILDALEGAGLRDDTLIVYTTDHGDTVGSRGLWGKTVLYEESAGIPLIVAGPPVPAGQVSATPVTLVDGYPTILETAGAPSLPGGAPRPGRSWVELADKPEDEDRVAFCEYHAMGATSGAYLVRRGRYKLHHYVGFEPELFDLEADPEETLNLAGDPAFAGVLAEYGQLLRDIVDPEDVDRRAKAHQVALVERFGGREAASRLGTVAETPVPGGDKEF
jgi:choline-sulfatase